MLSNKIIPTKFDPNARTINPLRSGDVIPAAAVEQAWLKLADHYYPGVFKAPEPVFGKKPFYGDIQANIIGMDGFEHTFAENGDTAHYRYVLYNEDWEGAGDERLIGSTSTVWLRQRSTDGSLWVDDGVAVDFAGTPFTSIATGTAVYDPVKNLVHYYVTGYGYKPSCGLQVIAHFVANGLKGVAKFDKILVDNPYAANPVGDSANRDPGVSFDATNNQWVMVVARVGGFEVLVNKDASLQTQLWESSSFIGVSDLGVVECGKLLPMRSADTGATPWVLIFGGNGYGHVANPDAPDPMITTAPYFLTGKWDGAQFVLDPRPTDITASMLDYGADAYPPAVYQRSDGTTVMTTSVMNWGYANQLPTTASQGMVADPSIITLTGGSGAAYEMSVKPSGCFFSDRALAKFSSADQFFSGGTDETTGIIAEQYMSILGQTGVSLPRSWRFDFNVMVALGNVSVDGGIDQANIEITGGGRDCLNIDFVNIGKGYITVNRKNYGLTPYNADGLSWYGDYRLSIPPVADGANLPVSMIYDAGVLKMYVAGRALTIQTFPCVGSPMLFLHAHGASGAVNWTGMQLLTFNYPTPRASGLSRFEANGLYLDVDYAKDGVTGFQHIDPDDPGGGTMFLKPHQITFDDKPRPMPASWPQPGPNDDPSKFPPALNLLGGLSINTVRNGPMFISNNADEILKALGYIYSSVVAPAPDNAGKAIQTNAANIATNKTAIQANATDIQTNATAIQTNAKAIQTNATAIQTNAKAIQTNKTAIQANATDIQANASAIQTNTAKIGTLQTTIEGLPGGATSRDISMGQQAGSGGTLSAMPVPNLSAADVYSFQTQAATIKGVGLAYAGKYALTPMRYDLIAGGYTNRQIWGVPPADGITACGVEDNGVPIITDAVNMLYDDTTGIYYRYDQFQRNSQDHKGGHWFLDGPGVSVSVDGLKWAFLTTLLYSAQGGMARTGMWLDKTNKLGYGAGALFIFSQGDGNVVGNLLGTAPTVQSLGYTPSTLGDSRLYWMAQFNCFMAFSVNGANAALMAAYGATPKDINLANKQDWVYHTPEGADGQWFPPSKDNKSVWGSWTRVECPCLLPMIDQQDGTVVYILVCALQDQGNPAVRWETQVAGSVSITKTAMTDIQPLRMMEYGRWAYAQAVVDPQQRDGADGKPVGAPEAVMMVGCYYWALLNGNLKVPNFGFGGGAWIDAKVVMRNRVPFYLPNDKFAQACLSGAQYERKIAPGGVAAGVLQIPTGRFVWRAAFTAPFSKGQSPSGSTIRFHFGTCWVDYFFDANGFIQIDPRNSGNYATLPDPKVGNSGVSWYDPNNPKTLRSMPIWRAFTADAAIQLVWEFDNGRIRLYNLGTGEIMSEVIWPNGQLLTSIEVLGNDFSAAGYDLVLGQESNAGF